MGGGVAAQLAPSTDIAPKGSLRIAARVSVPASNGGETTMPPRSAQARAVASTSSTRNVTLQCGCSLVAVDEICVIRPIASSTPPWDIAILGSRMTQLALSPSSIGCASQPKTSA
jgi:hypothetical protein